MGVSRMSVTLRYFVFLSESVPRPVFEADKKHIMIDSVVLLPVFDPSFLSYPSLTESRIRSQNL